MGVSQDLLSAVGEGGTGLLQLQDEGVSFQGRRGAVVEAFDGQTVLAGGNFRIVKTLAPGLYFVRVAGRGGAEGPYRLAVDVLGPRGAVPGLRVR